MLMTPIRFPGRLRRALLPLALLAALLGCRQEGLESYLAPRDPDPADTTLPVPHANHDHGAPDLSWEAPANWADTGTNGMRLGSYVVTDEAGRSADLSIIALAGDAGGLLANVNRWRQQMGLEPQTVEELAAEARPLEAQGFAWAYVTFAARDASVTAPGTGPAMAAPNPRIRRADDSERLMVLGALANVQGQTWFVKLTGPEPLLAAQQPDFETFLASFRLATPEEAP